MHNLGLVVRHLATTGPSSRAQIAATTGLTKGTISSLVAELLRSGVIREPGVQARGEAGRPGSLLEINTAGRATLGLEINVDYMAACVADLSNRMRFHRINSVPHPADAELAIAELAHLGRAAVAAAESHGLVVCGVAVALPGLVDPAGGLLHSAPNLGWHDLPFSEMFIEHWDIPAENLLVDNEANLAALAELWCGDGAEWGNYLHVSGEIGIGAGIVIDGELLRGSTGFAGEIGHLSLDVDGPLCTCGGRGCLERFCGQEAILKAAGIDSAPTTSIGQPSGSMARLLAALECGHGRALRAVEEAGIALGRGIGGVVNILDVDTVVLGGIFAPLAPWLEAPLTQAVYQQMIAAEWNPVRVVASKLGPEAAVRGAAGLVTRRLLRDPSALVQLGR